MNDTGWMLTDTELRTNAVRLQSDAWAAWNASYHEHTPDTYRAAGLALYQQAMAERILALFARLDEQNARLDALASPASSDLSRLEAREEASHTACIRRRPGT